MGWFSDLFSGSGDDTYSLVDEGLNLFNQYEQGQAKERAYGTQADNFANNANYELQLEKDANARGSETLEKYGVSAARYAGKQLAGQGASGVIAGSGSFQDVNRSTEQVFQQDMQTIMRNTMREAYGHQLAAESGFRASDTSREAGDTAMLSTQLGMAGSIITGDLADSLSKKYWE